MVRYWRASFGQMLDGNVSEMAEDILQKSSALRSICVYAVDEDSCHDTGTACVNRRKVLDLMMREYLTSGSVKHVLELGTVVDVEISIMCHH